MTEETKQAPATAGNDAALDGDIKRLEAASKLEEQGGSKEENALSKKEDEARVVVLQETKGLVSMILSPTLAIMAPNWKVTKQEQEALSEAYAAVLLKYFPQGPEQMGPEVAALALTFGIFVPRAVAGIPRKLEEKPAEGAVEK